MLPSELLKLIEGKIISDYIKEELDDINKVIYVKDLCFCKEKAVLRRKYRAIELDVLKKPEVQFGILIHRAIEEIFKSLDFDTEVSNVKIVGDYQVAGRIDAIINSKRGRYGVEIKTANTVHDAYKMQAKIYNWLFDLDSTILLFINEKKFFGVTISGRYKDDTILKLINNWKSPMWSYECKRCDYLMYCDVVKQKSLLSF